MRMVETDYVLPYLRGFALDADDLPRIDVEPVRRGFRVRAARRREYRPRAFIHLPQQDAAAFVRIRLRRVLPDAFVLWPTYLQHRHNFNSCPILSRCAPSSARAAPRVSRVHPTLLAA